MSSEESKNIVFLFEDIFHIGTYLDDILLKEGILK